MKKKSLLATYGSFCLDVVNQILLMNLVARELYKNDPAARESFEIIHKAYEILGSKEDLKNKIGGHAFNDFFEEHLKVDTNFNRVLDKFYIRGQPLSRFAVPETDYFPRYTIKRTSSNGIEPRFKIMQDVFQCFDRRDRLSNYANEYRGPYIDFINTVFGGARHINNTYGFSHHNLYTCLYDCEESIRSIIIPDYENSRNNLELLAIWLKNVTAKYEISLDEPIPVHKIFPIELGNHSLTDVVPLCLCLERTLLEKYSNELSDFESIEDYATRIAVTLKNWLTVKLSGCSPKIEYPKEILRNEYDAHLNHNKEWQKKAKPDQKGNIEQDHFITKKTSSIPTSCYSLLAYDHLQRSKCTHKEAVCYVKAKYCGETETQIKDEDFPEAGIVKQLRAFIKNIDKNKYSKIQANQIELLREVPKSKGTFFSNPLFFGD